MRFRKLSLFGLMVPIVLIAGSLVLSACRGPEKIPRPDDLIPEVDYVDLLVEMQHITTWRNSRPDSVQADSLKALVYEKFGITEDQFLRSHTYYQKDVDGQLLRIDEAIRQMEEEKRFIQAHIDSVRSN